MRQRGYDTAVDERRGALRRDVACAFATLALLANVLAGLLVSLHPATIDPKQAPIYGDRIVICTSTGMIVVDREGNVVPDQTETRDHYATHCLFCLPLMQGHVLSPAAGAALDEREAATAALGSSFRNHIKQSFKLESNQARAPPTV